MLTRILILVNVLVYVGETLTGGPDSSYLVANGLLVGANVAHGEYYRIVTSEFLHANFFHIATNMFALYQVGTYVETLYGSTRMAIIYALAILGAGISVVWFNYSIPTLGASGAVFGLFGALLAAGLRLGKPGRQLVQQSAGIIVLNLVLGFTIFSGFVSNAGHIGGLVAGFIFGYILFMGNRFNKMQQREEVAVAAQSALEPGQQIYEPPARQAP